MQLIACIIGTILTFMLLGPFWGLVAIVALMFLLGSKKTAKK